MMPPPLIRKLAAFVLLLAVASCGDPRQSWLHKSPSSGAAAPSDADASGVRAAPPPAIMPSTYVSAGKMLEAEGNLTGALEQYRRAVESDASDVAAWTRLGIVYSRLQRLDDAISAFHRAIEIAPDKSHLHNNLGFCLVLRGRYAQAEKSYRHALALKPGYPRARMNLGALLAETGRDDEAVREFERVVSRDTAYYNLGLILAAGRRTAAARRAFRQCLALNPNMREARWQLAQLHRKANESGRPTETAVAAVRSGHSPPPPAAMPLPTTQPATGDARTVDSPAPLPRILLP